MRALQRICGAGNLRATAHTAALPENDVLATMQSKTTHTTSVQC